MSRRTISKILNEAVDYVYYDGWTKHANWGDSDHPGFDLVGAINQANHESPRPTEELPYLTGTERNRSMSALRLMLDVIFPEEESHEGVSGKTAIRRLQAWNDEFVRQECDVTAALRRGMRRARELEEIGLLLYR